MQSFKKQQDLEPWPKRTADKIKLTLLLKIDPAALESPSDATPPFRAGAHQGIYDRPRPAASADP